MNRLLMTLSMLIVLTGCNLANAPVETEEVIVVTATPLPATETPTVFPESWLTPTRSTDTITENERDDCVAPSNWVTYRVQAGDTLFSIARNANSSVEELTRMNCLSSNALNVGQMLAIPQVIDNGAPDTNDNPIVYWLGSDTQINSESIEVGCGTYLTPITTNQTRTDDTAQNIEQALTALLNATQAPYRNLWGGKGLRVSSVTVDSNLQATITIEGNFLLGGVCSDAELGNQIVLTILTNADVNTIQINVDGNNLAQLLDQSGQSGSDAVFDSDQYSVPSAYR